MASGIFYPAANSDDGGWSSVAWYANESGLYLGNFDGFAWHVFVRFQNVTIPAGSVIDSAVVTFTCTDTPQSGTDVLTNCYFNDSDDAVAPTSIAEGDGLALTGLIAWDNLPSWSAGVQYSTPELKTILQTVTDRGGWSSGNAVMVLVKDDGSSADAERDAENYYNDPSKKVELHVTWDPPVTGEITEEINVLSEFDDNFGELNENVNVLSEFDDNFGFLSEDVSVLSEFDDNFGELNENVGVSSVFTRFVADAVFGEDASVNAAFIAEHTGELSEDASVNSEFICYQRPANIDAELPMIMADILGGQGGFLDATLPLITADIKSGAILEASLPSITASLEGKVGAVGNIDVTLPSLIANIEGKVETLGEIDAILPTLRASISGKTGDLATCEVILPMLLADIQGVNDLSGDIDAALPMIKPYMIGIVERSTCTVLRYSDNLML